MGYSLPSVIGVDGKAHAKELLHHSGMDFVPGGANCLSCLGNGLPSFVFCFDASAPTNRRHVSVVIAPGKTSCIHLCPWGGDHDGCHGIFSLRVRYLFLFQEIVLVLRHAIPPARASSLLLHGVFAVKCTSEIRRPAGKRPSVRRGPTKQAAGDFKWGRALSRLHQRLSQAGLPITEIQLIQPD